MPMTEEQKEAKREYQRRYREARREEDNERSRKWRKEHKEESKEYERKRSVVRKEYNRKWREEHKEHRKKQQEKYQEEHRVELNERHRRYYEEHREEMLERNRRYQQDNPEKISANSQRRRQRKSGLPYTLTNAEWLIILDHHFHRCHYCGKNDHPLHQEHKIPVAKGGGYTKENIVPACPECNSRKHTTNYKKFVKAFGEERQANMFD